MALRADIVIVTEYATSSAECALDRALRDAGFAATCASPHVDRENQILIVATHRLRLGHIQAPPIGPSVPPNFLHAFFPDLGIDLLGLRIPDYSGDRRRRHATWDWLETAAVQLVGRPAILVGDFNTDPGYSAANCGDRIDRLKRNGWQQAEAPGASYWNPKGRAVSIDHLFASPYVSISAAMYVHEAAGYALVKPSRGRILSADEPAMGVLSDHAALVVRLSVPSPQFPTKPEASDRR